MAALMAEGWMGVASAADGKTGKPRILIAYFSHTDTTKGIAERLQKKTGGALYRIEPMKSYPLERQAVLDRGRKETREGIKPELKGEPPKLDNIDLVLIGGPVWYGTLSPPLSSFLAQADLKGKIVAPFCTHGGGLGAYFEDFKNVVSKGATMQDGLDLSRVKEMKDEYIEKAISDWVAKLFRSEAK